VMEFTEADIYKILLAVLCGGLISDEREFRDKSAGFRTLIFICVGAAMFTILSMKFCTANDDHTRIAASIVSGVGFLGAGAIMRSSQRIIGLTTAATIWLTAALGMAIGAGSMIFSGIVTAIALIILWLFPFLEKIIDQHTDSREYEISCLVSPEIRTRLEQELAACKLKLHESSCTKSEEALVFKWFLTGRPANHARFMNFLIDNQEILTFHC